MPSPETLQSVYGVFQRFTGFKARYFGRFDLDWLASLRVTTGTGRTLFNTKGTKTNQYDLISAFQRVSHRVNHCIQSTASSRFWNVSRSRYSINQFRLVHTIPL